MVEQERERGQRREQREGCRDVGAERRAGWNRSGKAGDYRSEEVGKEGNGVERMGGGMEGRGKIERKREKYSK